MKTFKDATGKDWTIAVNVGTIKRVRDLAGFDLLKIAEGQKALTELSDPIMLVNVLYCCIKPQADKDGITDEKFGESLYGDVLEGASDALLADVSDFFPSHRREPLKKALAKMKELNSKASQIVLTRLDDPAIEAAMTKALQGNTLEISGKESGN